MDQYDNRKAAGLKLRALERKPSRDPELKEAYHLSIVSNTDKRNIKILGKQVEVKISCIVNNFTHDPVKNPKRLQRSR